MSVVTCSFHDEIILFKLLLHMFSQRYSMPNLEWQIRTLVLLLLQPLFVIFYNTQPEGHSNSSGRIVSPVTPGKSDQADTQPLCSLATWQYQWKDQMIKKRKLSCNSDFPSKYPPFKVRIIHISKYSVQTEDVLCVTSVPSWFCSFALVKLRSLRVLMLLTFIIETKCFLLKTTLPVPVGFLLSKEKRLNEVFLQASSSNKCMNWEQERNYERLLIPCGSSF